MLGLFSRTSAKKTPPSLVTINGSITELETRENPVLIAGPDLYTSVPSGTVFTRDALNGLLSNDRSTTNANANLSVTIQSRPAYTNAVLGPALPSETLVLRNNGSFTLTVPSDYDPNFGDIVFNYTLIDLNNSNDPTVTGTVRFTITQPQVTGRFYAVGSGPGVKNEVRVYQAGTGIQSYVFSPYEDSFTGGVRVTTGDMNGDGIDDFIVSPSVGGSARIRIIDGKSQAPIADFIAFEPTFRGGAEIAVGKVDSTLLAPNSFRNELVVGAGIDGGPRVTVYSFTPGPIATTRDLIPTVRYDFFAYEQSQRNGARVAVGNVYGTTGTSQRDFIVTGAAPGGAPVVSIFDSVDLAARLPLTNTPAAKASFFAFDSNNRAGVSVAVGKFTTNSITASIVTGSGDVFRIFDASGNLRTEKVLTQTDGSLSSGGGFGSASSSNPSTGSSNFGNASNGLVTVGNGVSSAGTGGIRVAVTDRNSDGVADILVGAATGQLPRLRIFNGTSLTELENNLVFSSSFIGGVFVGGNTL